MPEKKERSIISDKLVVEKTGHTMADWFVMLDKKGAKKDSHAAIFEILSGLDGIDGLDEWNRNLLTTSYEWSRKLKERGEKSNGFEISTSKTIQVPNAALYKAWVNDKTREQWLPNEAVTFRKLTLNKSCRITWADGITSLAVDFYEKGPGKSQVVVQHQKIADRKDADELQLFWTGRLDILKRLLENQ